MWKRVASTMVLALVLALFLAMTGRVLFEHSYLGFFLIANANSGTQLMMLDLVISLSLITIWMVLDAREKKKSFLPFIAITLLFGVAGPLLYLITRGQGKNLQRVTALLLLGALSAAAATFWNYADLRNDAVKEATPAAAQRGRELLRRVAQAHGLRAWRAHTTMETVATDTWAGAIGWWPEPQQRFRSQALLGTFTSRVELLDGPARGEVWGIQAWAPYRASSKNWDSGEADRSKRAEGRPGKSERAEGEAAGRRGDELRHIGSGRTDDLVFLDAPAPEIEFYLPTLQYFNELPFRLLSADTVIDAGEASHRGKDYSLIFVTWGSPEPNPDYDQYLLWIDQETLLIDMVRYTVRDAIAMREEPMRTMMRSVALGTMHYDDYREVDGIMVPFEQTVTLPSPELTQYPLSENFFHRLVVEEVRFDTVEKETLMPDPARGVPADRKPSG